MAIGWAQGTDGNGIRSSSTSSYIRPVISRTNLDVVINTLATKLLTSGNDAYTGEPIFCGVEVAQSSTCMHALFSMPSRN